MADCTRALRLIALLLGSGAADSSIWNKHSRRQMLPFGARALSDTASAF